MGCINAPTLPEPTLGGGLSIDVVVPPQSFDANLCCKIVHLGTPPVHIPLGIPIPPGISAVIVAQIKLVQAFIDGLSPKCPRE